MVTDTQIDNLYDNVKGKYAEISRAFEALSRIKLIRPNTGPTRIPYNPNKFRDYTQAERDTIFADTVTELQRIKASL